jgi:uncharacterized membrane protein YkvA (DUF1232 family)
MSDNEIKWREIDYGDSPTQGELNYKQVKEQADYVEANIWLKLEEVGKKISFAKDVAALYRYMTDKYVSWHRKAIIVAALIYFISPIDAVPDIAPLIGYLDDLGVITALLKYLGSELIPYYNS